MHIWTSIFWAAKQMPTVRFHRFPNISPVVSEYAKAGRGFPFAVCCYLFDARFVHC